MATLLDALDAAVNHHMAGRLTEAARLYRRVLAVEPAQPDALHLLGVTAAQHGAAADALAPIVRSLRVRPASAQARAHLGGALRALGRAEEAADALTGALALDPALGDALDGLGAARHALAAYEQAALWCGRAIRLRPGHPDTLVNLGTALRDLRRFADAEICFAAALARAPNHAEAHLARATGRLVRGDLRAGWEEFEWRWRRYPAPPWAGEPLEGRTILLHAEQGFGDSIQFARYAPLVARAGGRVVLAAHPLLTRLLSRLDPQVRVVEQDAGEPPHDLHCPLMSLPRAFGTTLDRIPSFPAYLSPDPADRARWAARLDGPGGRRVGLVWAGNPRHRNDRNRSIPADRLAPLLDVPGLRLVSLQTGPARDSVPSALRDRLERPLEISVEGARDFADTAALVANLDLVVTVDTAIVHLAGALGVPAWLLLPSAPDWRWLLDRADSPWYPSLRLYRQPRPGDWDSPLAAIAARLRSSTGGRPGLGSDR